MPAGSSRRIQTTKQAKAAFKARGANYVSDAEKKRLARGAELLDRADRIRAQEARKRSWPKSREQKDGETERLGSERRLDKFGYASSQFHLGKFFGAGPKAEGSGRDEGTTHETMEVGRDGQAVESGHGASNVVEDKEEQRAASPVDGSLFDDPSPLIETTVKAAHVEEPPKTTRAMPAPPLATAKRKMANPTSFSSDDGLFDADTLLQLDRAVDELEARRSLSPVKGVPISTNKRVSAMPARDHHMAPPARKTPSLPTVPAAALRDDSMTTALRPVMKSSARGMPPPSRPPAKITRYTVDAGLRRAVCVRGELVYGVSMEDLEAVAMADFVLSQMPSR